MADRGVVFVGVATLVLHIPGARSLKDKRSVVKSLKDKVIARFHVSMAEVGALDVLQRAELGVAVVSNESAVCDEVLAHITSVASSHRDAILADVSTEVLPFSQGL